MRFPSIKAIAKAVRSVNRNVDNVCDVRLQVWSTGWRVRSGDAQYDQDHTGYWGASSVPGNGQRFNSTEIAKDLIEQAKDHAAQCEAAGAEN